LPKPAPTSTRSPPPIPYAVCSPPIIRMRFAGSSPLSHPLFPCGLTSGDGCHPGGAPLARLAHCLRPMACRWRPAGATAAAGGFLEYTPSTPAHRSPCYHRFSS
jgi:hypothetical protein